MEINKHTFGTLGVYDKGIETKTKGLCIMYVLRQIAQTERTREIQKLQCKKNILALAGRKKNILALAGRKKNILALTE